MPLPPERKPFWKESLKALYSRCAYPIDMNSTSKVYKYAKCSFVCGRDENAARNNFLKYLKE
jgi:hypothetical protein